MLRRQKLSKAYLSISCLLIALLSPGCDLASGGKSYKRVVVDKEDEKHIYSCEENFSNDTIEVQAKKADEYLFNKIKESSDKLVRSIFDSVEEESKKEKPSSSWSEFIRKVSFVFNYTSKTLKMQNSIKKEAKQAEKKFGCIFIDIVE